MEPKGRPKPQLGLLRTGTSHAPRHSLEVLSLVPVWGVSVGVEGFTNILAAPSQIDNLIRGSARQIPQEHRSEATQTSPVTKAYPDCKFSMGIVAGHCP